MERFVAKSRDGEPLAILEAADELDARLFILKGGVPGSDHVVSLRQVEAQVLEAVRKLGDSLARLAGLSAEGVQAGVRGRSVTGGPFGHLPVVQVGPSGVPASRSASTTPAKESGGHKTPPGATELREPGRPKTPPGAIELIEPAGSKVAGGIVLREAAKPSQTKTPEVKATFGVGVGGNSSTGPFEWAVKCPWCFKSHRLEAGEDAKAMLGKALAMPCGLGSAILLDDQADKRPATQEAQRSALSAEGERLAKALQRLGLGEAGAKVGAIGRS